MRAQGETLIFFIWRNFKDPSICWVRIEFYAMECQLVSVFRGIFSQSAIVWRNSSFQSSSCWSRNGHHVAQGICVPLQYPEQCFVLLHPSSTHAQTPELMRIILLCPGVRGEPPCQGIAWIIPEIIPRQWLTLVWAPEPVDHYKAWVNILFL